MAQKRRWYANARMWLMSSAASMILSVAAAPGNPNPPAGKEGAKKAPSDVLIFDAIGGAKVVARH